MVVLMFVNLAIRGSDPSRWPVSIPLFHLLIFSKGSQWDQMAWELASPTLLLLCRSLQLSLDFREWGWLLLHLMECDSSSNVFYGSKMCLTITYVLFILVKFILHFYYWYFIHFWKQICTLHWKWTPKFWWFYQSWLIMDSRTPLSCNPSDTHTHNNLSIMKKLFSLIQHRRDIGRY